MKYEFDELEEIFDDEERLRLARLLSLKTPPQVDADPAFRSALRRQLMHEAWDMAHPSAPWWRQLFAPRGMAWGGAAAGVVAVATLALLFAYTQYQSQRSPEATGPSVPVATNQAFSVSFNTDMNHSSVEKSIRIEPATEVRYHWEGNTLQILPSNGSWAPNVQYRVTVEPAAESTAGKSLPQATTLPVTTQPTPSPPPTPSPTPTPTVSPTPPSGLTNLRKLVDVSPDQRSMAWSPDGQFVYVVDAQGRLAAVPTGAGDAVSLTESGVSLAALSPTGKQLAFVRAGRVLTIPVTGGVTSSFATADSQVLALGWRDGSPIWATSDAVFSTSGSPVKLADGAQPLAFSPAGDMLVVRSPGNLLKTIDLAGNANSTTLPQATAGGAFLAWSPDGKRAAYRDGSQVVLYDLAAGARVAVNFPAAAAAWSSQGQLLLAAPQALDQVGADGSGLRALAQGSFEQPAWAPNGTDLAFRRSGQLFLARAQAPGVSAPPGLGAGYARVDDFMRARLPSGSADQAAASLDSAARASYGPDGLQLTPAGYSRYYVVAAQDTGSSQRFTVRLIFAKDKLETQFLDESLILQPDSAGQLLVHAATATVRQDLGKSPQLTSVAFNPGQLRLSFDSDLDARTVPEAITVIEVNGGSQVAAPVTFSGARTATVDTTRLTPGASYRLRILTSLKDVSGRAVSTEYSLDFVGTSLPPAPKATPLPSGSPSPPHASPVTASAGG